MLSSQRSHGERRSRLTGKTLDVTVEPSGKSRILDRNGVPIQVGTWSRREQPQGSWPYQDFHAMKPRVDPRTMRRTFVNGLFVGLRVVWPILSGLLAAIVGLGLVIGLIEGWSVQESIYFAFVSGLTIGYGDLVARSFVPRALAIVIGICGVLLTALLAAVAVKALLSTLSAEGDGKEDV